MQYKKLGNTGLLVSELCLGTMTVGSQEKNGWGMPTAKEEESFAMLNYFAEKGGNFIDTADIYGDSEEVLGRWLSTKRREDFVIATKVRGRAGPGANDIGLSRKHILSGVENSLKRMKTDYIDLYQVHSWDILTPLSETWSTLNDLVHSGKVRYLGISNYTAWQLQKTVDLCKQMNWEAPVCLQPLYNLIDRSTEWDLATVCQNEGVGIIPWSPLAGGWLSGKITRDMKAPSQGSRVAWAEQMKWKPTDFSTQGNERTWKILDEIQKISQQTGKSFAQISLRWLCQKPGVTSPIIGAKTMDQLKDNMGSIGWQLTAEQMKLLDAASHLDLPYPWNHYSNFARDLF